MRISDWSSDVCSSDLLHLHFHLAAGRRRHSGRDRHVGLLRRHHSRHRAIDFLTVGGASTRNVDAAAADIILGPGAALTIGYGLRSAEHTSELHELMRISYHVFS